jgi:hypothetical protein
MDTPSHEEITCRGCGYLVALVGLGEIRHCPACGERYTRAEYCPCGHVGDYPETCERCGMPLCWPCAEAYGGCCMLCVTTLPD